MSAKPQPATAAANSKVKLKREVEKAELQPPVEEHLILRVQNVELAAKLKQLAKNREPMDDISIHFSGPRKASFKYAKDKYPATLVDLPCILESQKTWDNRQLYKICDISQMLVVAESDNPSTLHESTEDYVWPHGISAPLKFVRTRRFRKRISKRAIENVEREVERLLQADSEAIQVEREIVEVAPDDAGDDEDRDDGEITPPDQADEMGSEAGGEFNSDDELAAELEDALEAELAVEEGGDDDDDEEEDLEEEEEQGDIPMDDSDEDDVEDEETRELREEIAELEGTILEKEDQVEKEKNPIMRTRFEGIVRKLNEELQKKRAALSTLISG
ncbi:TAFII55 protein conserved region-domain-containing protein [Obelidium mucronatum]|nr:TAFII55 protein conserved region-domain-containing protein [Obelidium mucronatum]